MMSFFYLAASVALSATITDVKFVKVAFSPGHDARQLILDELRRASKSVDLAMFFINDPDLLDALCHVADKRDVCVRLFANEAITQPAYKPFLDRLAQHGVEVYIGSPQGGSIHAKCAVIDGEVVISGAANWTEYAFEKNFEDTIVIQSPTLARNYLEFFNYTEKYCQPLSVESPSSVREKVMFPKKVVSRAAEKVPPMKFVSNVESIEVFFNPGRDGNHRFIEMIRQAKERIDVGMYLFDDKETMDAISEIAQKGEVKVRVLCDQGMLSKFYLPKAQRLWDAGVDLLYWPTKNASLHLKCSVIDQKYVWTGSANWTQSAMDENAEDMLMVESPEVAKQYIEMLNMISAECVSFEKNSLWSGFSSAPISTNAIDNGLPMTCARTNYTGLATPAPANPFGVNAAVDYLDDDEYYPVLMNLIRSAHQSIFVTMFAVPERKTWRENVESVLNELCKAAERGVYIYLVLHMPDSESDPLSRAHSNLADRLRCCGVDVRFCLPSVGLHDKMVIVDLAKILIGSHNWSEGALNGDGVYESSALLILPQQDVRFADYVFSRKVIADMRSKDLWENEIARLRHMGTMNMGERKEFIQKLDDLASGGADLE